MLKQLLAQATNGFSVKDIPFLFLQLTVSAILAWIIRHYWKKSDLSGEEDNLLKYLMPVQVVFTVLAIFSIQSPWMIVLFGFMALIPVAGSNIFSLRSKMFYVICLFIAYGCGAANLALTTLVTGFIIIPVLFLNQPGKKE